MKRKKSNGLGKDGTIKNKPNDNQQELDTTNRSANEDTFQTINVFRNDLYNGTITLENMPETEEKLANLLEVQKNILLAEVYTHFNIPQKAEKYLKTALKQEGITDAEKKVVAQALQITRSSKANTVLRRKKWNVLNGIEEER